MKFYQIIIFVVLSILYATTIFGSKDSTSFCIDEDVCGIIDKYRGPDDGFFKETGRIKPYSRTLDLMAEYSPAIFTILYAIILLSTLPRKFPGIGLILASLSTACLASVFISIGTELKIETDKRVKFPEKVIIENLKEEIFIKGPATWQYQLVELLDILPKNRAPLNHTPQTDNQDLGQFTFFELEDGKVNAYLSYHWCEPENKFNSLPTPEKINSFALFKKGTTMVTASKRGIMQYTLQENENLYKIMNPD